MPKSSIAVIKGKMAAIRQEMQDSGKEAYTAEFEKFFEKNENVAALRWTQYTPYFNDGDACVFSVHDLHVKFVGHVPDAEALERTDEDEDGFEYVSSYGDKNKKRDKAILKWWTGIADDDLLEYAFGDHVQVTVNRDGIEVDEYDHD